MNARAVSARELAPSVGGALLALAALFLSLRLAVSGVLPGPAVALVAPASLLTAAWSVDRAAAALGFTRDEPILRKHGFWVVAVGTIVGLPRLGASSLVDPWETHYAEVAREMIERRDFVSPWWANEGWFMSKPAFTFWVEAASMKLLGVHTGPNEVLASGGGRLAHPEWAVRFPAFAFALVGSYVVYAAVARVVGRRAALIGALVLWTAPGFAILAHQAITDMPLVIGATAALALVLVALTSTDAERTREVAVVLGGRRLTLHAGHLLAAAILLGLGPQILGLAAEHVHLGGGGLRLGAARYFAGSPHACGLPSQPACAPQAFAHPRLAPGLEALALLPVTGWLVLRAVEERRVARLAALAAWGIAAVATMAKGPAGLVVPAAGALAYVAHTRSLRSLARLEIPTGVVLAAALVLPWYFAAWARHGRVFVDELVMRHMLGRTLEHLHDTNEGEDVGFSYVVRHLGFATFPWSGFVAAALAHGLATRDRSRRAAAKVVMVGGALCALALVAAMRTKFHHYVLIALPPLAILTGIWLDERVAERRGASRLASTAGVALASVAVALLVARDLGAEAGGAARLMHLVTYRYSRAWPSVAHYRHALVAVGVMFSLGALAFAVRRARGHGLVAAVVVAVVAAVTVGNDYVARAAPDGGQRGVFEAYYRARGPSRAPIVAYHLNWKGENFYAGNDVAIFIASGAPMKSWLEARRLRGDRVVFFVTERGGVGGLRAELEGVARGVEELTDRSVSAEFTLVRAELGPPAPH